MCPQHHTHTHRRALRHVSIRLITFATHTDKNTHTDTHTRSAASTHIRTRRVVHSETWRPFHATVRSLRHSGAHQHALLHASSAPTTTYDKPHYEANKYHQNRPCPALLAQLCIHAYYTISDEALRPRTPPPGHAHDAHSGIKPRTATGKNPHGSDQRKKLR